jgi:hypothetical protein
VQERANDSDDKKEAQKAAKAIEMIIWTENTKEAYDRIRMATKEVPFHGGIDKLDVPARESEGEETAISHEDTTDAREILIEVDEIHKALMERNKRHFNQAMDTPFGDGMLYVIVGYSGIKKAAREIVNGDFLTNHSIEEILLETRQVIAELAMPEIF